MDPEIQQQADIIVQQIKQQKQQLQQQQQDLEAQKAQIEKEGQLKLIAALKSGLDLA